MQQKIQTILQKSVWLQLRDIRVVGFLVFGLLVLLVSYSGVSVIQSNYELERQVARLQQENDIAALENTNIKLRNEYYKTDQYVELVARKQYGKGMPGETVVLVPKSVALKYTVAPLPQQMQTVQAVAAKPQYQKNLDAWRAFLIRSEAVAADTN